MKKRLTLLLTTAVMLSMFACTNPDKNEVNPTEPPVDDGRVTVYLPVSRTEYLADGSKGHKQELYTYTDKGLILTHTSDMGALQEVWNEEDGIYDYVAMPFDGNPEMKVEITYNDRGSMLRCIQMKQKYSMSDQIFISTIKDTGKDYTYSYFYLPDGGVDYVERLSVRYINTPFLSQSFLRHHYDDAGRLTEIGLEWGWQDQYSYDKVYTFQYDTQGRLIAYTNYATQGYHYTYRFEYNSAGQIARMTRSWEQDGSYQGEVVFAYDAQGRLTARLSYDGNMKLIREQICQYRDGKLYKFSNQPGKTVIITTDESEAGAADVTLVEDAHGNVVKRIEKNGDFQWFEYKAFRLTPEEAQIAQRSFYCYHQLGFDGQPSTDGQLPQLEPGMFACLTVSFPVSVLYPYDVALKE